jgi:vacuolar-type H+-ATPase subunit H
MSKKSSSDYEVGKYRPPTEHQFQPGQSGNPLGRPKGSKSWKRVMEEELSKEISVTEQGVEAKVSKMEALAKRLVSDALNGNAKALSELLKQVNRHLGDDQLDSKDLPASEEDIRLLMKFAQRAVAVKAHKEDGDDHSHEF